MDWVRKHVMEHYRKKKLEAGVHVKQKEPHKPWSTAAEAAKREMGGKWFLLLPPQCLRDYWLEHDAYWQLCSGHGIYTFNGQVSLTMISSKTANIFTLAAFKRFL